MPKPIILHKTTSTTATPVGAIILQTSPSTFMTTGDGAVLAGAGEALAGAGTTHGYGTDGAGVGTTHGAGTAGAGEASAGAGAEPAGAGQVLAGGGEVLAGAGEASVGAGINPFMVAAGVTDVTMPLTVHEEVMPEPYQAPQ